MKINFIPALCCAFLGILASCGPKYPGYQRTSDGLYYRLIETNPEATVPQNGDFLLLSMDYFLNDSLLYSSVATGEEPRIQLNDSKFKGDILGGLALMHVGDSASFIVKADSTCTHMFGQDPQAMGVKPSDKMRFEIRLKSAQSKEEFEEELNRMVEEAKSLSKSRLESYISENNITTRPSASGVYYWTTQAGNGIRPQSGDQVEVHYVGRLLDGRTFESSYDNGQSFKYIVGEGYVIPGWEEVLPKMHEGEKATVVIPFEMAYNEQTVGPIPPYTNLVYDIELLHVTPAAELARQIEEEMAALKAQSEKDLANYLRQNNITVEPRPSGLYYVSHKECSDIMAVPGYTARIKFDAYYLDGTVLGSSDSLGVDYYEVPVGQGKVLRGLEEGISYMAKGENATLIIPYTLAYGESGYGAIPPYTNLVFNVEVLDVVKTPEQPTLPAE